MLSSKLAISCSIYLYRFLMTGLSCELRLWLWRSLVRVGIVVCLLNVVSATVRATTYVDTTNDLFTATAPQLDIVSVEVTNDIANLYFNINLVGNPLSPNWGYYCIALVTDPGGCTNGNGSGLPIALTDGINYWVKCNGWGSPELWQYSAGTQAWSNTGGANYSRSGNAITLSVPYASLGLAVGADVRFDVYTSSSGSGAVDDLANTNMASSWWNVSYTNDLAETYSSAHLQPPTYGTLSVSRLLKNV
jgi:hypothetical protein